MANDLQNYVSCKLTGEVILKIKVHVNRRVPPNLKFDPFQ